MTLAYKTKDKATGNLDAGINASVLSIPLEAGDGSLFPQPYSGVATSLGTSSTLNCTGIGASGVVVGDHIHNVTDDSWATVETVATDSITTSKLKGGTDNTWQSADAWRVNEFVITLATINADGDDTAYEEVLVSGRSTDTLAVPTGGRGFNGTVAQAFGAGDYVQLRVTSPIIEEIKKVIRYVNKQVDTNTDSIATNATDIDNVENGASFYAVATGSANAYAVTLSPAPASYTAGLTLRFKANFTATGACTINVNGLGAKSIKRKDGASNPATGDIQNGQIVTIVYDGTNFQMQTPVGQDPTAVTVACKYTSSADSNDISSGTGVDWDTKYQIPANDLSAGVSYLFEAWGVLNGGTNSRRPSISLKFGSTTLFTFNPWIAINTTLPLHIRCKITCRSTGGSGTVQASGTLTFNIVSATNPLATTDTVQQVVSPTVVTVDTTAASDLKLYLAWNVDDGTGKSAILRNVEITRIG